MVAACPEPMINLLTRNSVMIGWLCGFGSGLLHLRFGRVGSDGLIGVRSLCHVRR